VVDLSFFPDFIDGRRQILVQDSTGMSLDRRATVTCVSLRVADLFIDSQSLVGNGGGSASLPPFVLTTQELGGGLSLRWLQETLGIIFLFLGLLGFYLQI
jgi:hypothetical protein